MKLLAVLGAALLFAGTAFAQSLSAKREMADGIEVIRLADPARKIQVTVVPSLGNNSVEMLVNGTNVFWSPYKTVGEFKAKPVLLGNPFLGPWANRLDGDGFYANGQRYSLDPAVGNVRRDNFKQPIHGLLLFSPDWRVTTLRADQNEAVVTSKLEPWRDPRFAAQFPFAHTIEMTYRLKDGALEVETALHNHSTEAMPVGIGFHPYFQLTDAPRSEWTVRLPAKNRVLLSSTLVPTGEREPNPYQGRASIAGKSLDDVFDGLERGADGYADFSVQGKQQRITVRYGQGFPVAVVYSPQDRSFICFEPMTGPTNAFNLHQAGKYPDLQNVAPGATWRASYWVKPEGF